MLEVSTFTLAGMAETTPVAMAHLSGPSCLARLIMVVPPSTKIASPSLISAMQARAIAFLPFTLVDTHDVMSGS